MIDRINQPKILITNKNNKSPESFKGAGTMALSGLRALNNSQAIGASAVDLCSMVIPRTAVEMKNRGFQSGIETAIREGSSWLLFALVGVIGMGASILTSGKINKDFGIKAQQIFANGDTLNNMSSIWNKANGNAKEYFGGFLSSIKGLNGTEWKTVSEEAKPVVIENLTKLAEKTKELSSGQSVSSALKREVKDLKELVVSQITRDTGAGASFKLKAEGAKKVVSTNIGELVDNAVALSNSFGKEGIKDNIPKFVRALSKNKIASTVLGLGICAALCMSVQPLNRYLTKKRTGEDGFVGVKGRKADNSKEFKALKTGLGIGFSAMALKTIGKLSDLAKNVQFNGKFATINQFKLLYGLTISSRFMAARDKDELRESVIKDTLGFTNWLIFGGMVSKLVARGIGGKELINNPVAQTGGKKGIKYAAQWLSKANVKSYDEVLLPKVKEFAKNGKVIKFTEMFKNADSATKTKLMKIAGSQVAGYLFSGFALGVGIAKLNIFITKKLNEKRAKNNPQTNNQNAQGGLDTVLDENKKAADTFLKYAKDNLSYIFKDFA